MKHILPELSCFLLLILFLSGRSGDQKNCELKKDCDGIKVYSCISTESDFNDIEAEFDLKATCEDYIELVMDVEKYDEWHYKSVNPRVLEKISEKELIYYEQISAPWPVSDRDLVLRLLLQQNPETNSLIVTLESLPDYLPRVPDIVRVSKFFSIMTLTPGENSSVKVEFHLEVDPGGFLPAWLVNTASTLGPYETFMRMKEKIE